MLTRLSYLIRRYSLLLTGVIYCVGVAFRVIATFVTHRPENIIFSDMALYVDVAHALQKSSIWALSPNQVTHPLGFPILLSWLLPADGTYLPATLLQLTVSSLVPLAIGLLGAASFGKSTGYVGVALASVYFPFIELGSVYVTEIHFIFYMALGFAALLAATQTRTRGRRLTLAFFGGLALSIALTMKALALPATAAFFLVYAFGALGVRGKAQVRDHWRTWFGIAAMTLLGALPIASTHSAICTHANRGTFCIAGNKSSADLLLGHSGRVKIITWKGQHSAFSFASPGAYQRGYLKLMDVPFDVFDGPANTRMALKWIAAHPSQAAILSLNHVYDAFLGPAMWPSIDRRTWPLGDLFQQLFVLFLLFPLACILKRECRPGLRSFVSSRVLLTLSPLVGLIVTLMIATGEIRYRVPFDMFIMVVVGAQWIGRLRAVPPPPFEPLES
jgi:hypothetical protein